MKKHAAKLVLGVSILLSSASVVWADIKCREIKLVAPFTAGGANDVAARLVARGLNPLLKIPTIVENRPGAAGNVGTRYVISARADGCTLLVHGTAVGFYPHMFKSLGFDPIRDLAVVGSIGVSPTVIVSSNKELSSLQDLFAWAKKNPGGLNYGSAGVGVINHLAVEEIARRSGTKLVHVPYRGGSGATQDAVTGQLHFATLTLASVSQFVDSGNLNLLAVLQPKPTALAPKASTTSNEGFPDINAGHHMIVMAPVKTGADVIKALSAALMKVVGDPALRANFAAIGVDPVPMASEPTRELVRKTGEDWAPVVKRLNIQM